MKVLTQEVHNEWCPTY